jgi:CheY-like chemotaxis protein
MARVRLIHWNGVEGRERSLRLASLGHQAQFDDHEGPGLLRLLRGTLQEDPPDAILIDLSRLPSHGREVALALRMSKDTRHIPIVFVDGDPDKVARLKAILPDATYTSWGRLETALPKAIARPVTDPFVPPSKIYTGRPTVEKLGVKPGMKVCVLGAPKGVAELLAPLPKGATLTAKASPTCELFLIFVRSRRELATQLAAVARDVSKQTAWVIWPKQASGVKSDVNGNVVRETGLASGWVDFKVCSLDDTWSGLAFKRRK